MKKIKVLQIIPSFGVGGAEKLVLDYLYFFDNETVEIKAISMFENQNTINDEFIREKGLDVVYLDKKPGLDLSMFIKINKIIKEFEPDVIHSHMNTMKYLIFSKGKVKLFHTIHNEPEKDAYGMDKLANKFSFKYLKCTPITLSEELAEKANEYYGINNAIVVNNGIDFKKFISLKHSKEDLRKKLGLPTDSFIIGHVGRFMDQKNHDFLINIFAEVVKVKENSLLLLVGDGELRCYIEEKVKKLGLIGKVKFLGLRKDIPEIIKTLDVFLFPSLHEGFPITLIEAQVAGVRCVISDLIDRRIVLNIDTVPVSLNTPAREWCNTVLNNEIKGTPIDKIDYFDINVIVKQLERKYREE
ncbi:glycosyltransferase [Bacillus mangrovi]|uniref:Glycosyltransferase n=1 Tax=Metabacillus mangrovi TaxID=1491830 RepID=A0A7X2V5T0_9BACI|nr:glycosyltransferase [Metabacillus mangrovi]MTH54509.1 glycosyltransferase [Metabacillus mangrovi]